MPLPSVKEPGDDLDGIAELDATVDDSQQGSQSEVAEGSQGYHSNGSSTAHTASCSSGAERELDKKPLTGTTTQEQGKEDEARESVFMTQPVDSQVSSQRWNGSAQEGLQSLTANRHSTTLNTNSRQEQAEAHSASLNGNSRQTEAHPAFLNNNSRHEQAEAHSATLNTNSRQQQAEAWSSRQQTFQVQQIPTPQGLAAPPCSSVTGGSSTIQRQNTNSMTPVVGSSGSFLQPHIPPVGHSGQLQAVPGQLSGISFAPGYTPGMQSVNPAVAQAPQDIIVVKGKSYQKLGTIGKGGSSKVCALRRKHDVLLQVFLVGSDNRLTQNVNVTFCK